MPLHKWGNSPWGPPWWAGPCTSHGELQDRAVHGRTELLPSIHAYTLCAHMCSMQAARDAIGLLCFPSRPMQLQGHVLLLEGPAQWRWGGSSARLQPASSTRSPANPFPLQQSGTKPALQLSAFHPSLPLPLCHAWVNTWTAGSGPGAAQQVLGAAQPRAAIRAPSWDPKSCSWGGTASVMLYRAELCRPNGKSRAVYGSLSMSLDALWARPLILELAPDFSSFFRCLQLVFGFSSTFQPDSFG